MTHVGRDTGVLGRGGYRFLPVLPVLLLAVEAQARARQAVHPSDARMLPRAGRSVLCTAPPSCFNVLPQHGHSLGGLDCQHIRHTAPHLQERCDKQC